MYEYVPSKAKQNYFICTLIAKCKTGGKQRTFAHTAREACDQYKTPAVS